MRHDRWDYGEFDRHCHRRGRGRSRTGQSLGLRLGVLGGWLLALAATGSLPAWDETARDERQPTVGLPAHIDQLVLPGPELEVVPLTDRQAPIVLRIVERYPHGDDSRYDLEYYGLEPGTFDLRDYLQGKDGQTASELPALPVTIRSLLPAGQIEPHGLSIAPGQGYWSYRWQLAALATVWCVGLLWLVATGLRRRRSATVVDVARQSVAERLRSFLEQAVRGESFTTGKQAEFERLLVTFWRERLGLVQGTTAAEAMRRLREHPEAGEVLRQVEAWLHRPPSPDQSPASILDFERLLAPYQAAAPSAAGGERP